jgi:hypothetical protein
MTTFWDTAERSFVDVDRCLYHQGDKRPDKGCTPLKRRSTSMELHCAVFQNDVCLLFSFTFILYQFIYVAFEINNTQRENSKDCENLMKIA